LCLNAVGMGRGHPGGEIEPLHTGSLGGHLPELRLVDVGAHGDGHGAVVPEVTGEPAGVYLGDGDDAVVPQVVLQRSLGAPVGVPAGHGAHHEPAHRGTGGLGVQIGHAVVADVRRGHDDHLARV